MIILKKWFDGVRQTVSPPRFILYILTSLIVGGSLLLTLPIMTNSGQWTPLLDALFTATSALCVTGQVTLNTMEHWNYLGRTVIIILIEIGGLGFMTLWTSLFIVLGRRVDMNQFKIMQESLNVESISDIVPVTRYIVYFSLAVQFIGATLLSIDFIPRLGLAKGIYYSLFHAISAYCNAGFDLFGDSMIGFQDNPLVLTVIMLLIISGGLGFIVWRDLLTYRRNRRLLIHTKIVLILTATLLIGGTILFILAQWGTHPFGKQAWYTSLLNYLFLSVTPRTAGYANIDYSLLKPASIFLTMILMFIGGASGSTAGGMKITTVFVIGLYAVRSLQRQDISIFKRSISAEIVNKAVFMLISGVLVIATGSFILLMTETIPPGFGIEYLLMETFSCFGTVGLTMGMTPFLTGFGKFTLIVMMLIGRMGLLTFFWSFAPKSIEKNIHYPKTNILVG
ncbi:TrkH family potassium uptake protein [Eremococcus coleocola]|uniref:Potassium uptake protein, TrkH family n=1 Tax=Eremococcus coleocola ACS-139-V-Col8 TaxID=908337 RepID=E4KQR5_9LACT|nr:TrkH family potassium uptake protein [Eremococcus coleocola]EFR30562.1 potassium uptake protein, TrkH family [Eremococcus coleocola ACS-139-V-Col8]